MQIKDRNWYIHILWIFLSGLLEKTEFSHLSLWTNKEVSSHHSLNIVLEVLTTEKWQEKEIKVIQFKAEKIKLLMFANAMNVFIGNLPKSTNILLELIDEFSKVTGA